MGKPIHQTNFSQRDFDVFGQKLHDCLKALELLLNRSSFGCGNTSIGAELELYLLDADEQPLPQNIDIQKQLNDPQLALELNRYNLEYNLTPLSSSGSPFSDLEQEMLHILRRLHQLTSPNGGHVLPIGILPTLTSKDFGPGVMTDEPRYHVLSEALHKIRNPDLGIKIDGSDAIRLKQGDVTLEGACTSFQIHYRVDPSRFCLLWNSIQLVTPLVLGISANSPLLLGHRLWHETRVPLFNQSIDGRDTSSSEWQEPGRVSFGHGWLQSDPVGLFREMVNLYRPLIPVCSNEEPIATVKNGGTPKLEELCLHDGTVWSWNRPIYDPEIDPHLRIEMRALPAGPTPIDMVSNAALFIGLAEGLAEDLAPLLSALPFSYAEYNFYRAAQFGINASVIWPSSNQNSLKERPLIDVIKELLPVAERGLISIGVTTDEAKHMLGIIEERLSTQCNGAVWQLNQYSQLISKNLGQHEACKALVTAYRDRAMTNQPVAQWSNI